MKIKNNFDIDKLKNKAKKSICRFKIAGFGFNKKNELLVTAFNSPRYPRKMAGKHCEMKIMEKFPKSVKTILICRVGNSGKFLPIHPCDMCATKAKELGIKIYTLLEVI